MNGHPSDSGGRATDLHFDVHAGSRKHVDKRVDGEEVDLAAHEAGDARLGDFEELGSFSLAEAFTLDVLSESDHERGTEFHVFGLGGGFFDCVPYAGEALCASYFLLHASPLRLFDMARFQRLVFGETHT